MSLDKKYGVPKTGNTVFFIFYKEIRLSSLRIIQLIIYFGSVTNIFHRNTH